ncbi:MAG: glycosyltransferase [Bacteroidales bacterium]|nr:glycosyltransferase [Bacteroidales bacterium]
MSANNDIYLFCISHTKVANEWYNAMRPYCKEIVIAHPSKLVSYANTVRNILTSKPLQLGYWYSNKARQLYRQFEKRVQPDVVYCQMVRTMPIVQGSNAPKVIDFQDALSMNTQRRMESTRNILLRSALRYEYKALCKAEHLACDLFDRQTIIAETDRDAILHKNNSNIVIVPNGVDTKHFAPTNIQKKYDILFCGNMQYAPNIDAARYLIEQVLPRVKVVLTSVKVLIAGASPAASVRNLASEEVTISGWVDDMRQCYAQSRLFVAPMRIGSGLQNKLLEAMAMNLPCITTDIANASLKATDGQEILVGNDPQTLAKHIVTLLQNEPQSRLLATAGHNFVIKNYSWEAATAKLEQTLINAAQK